MDEPLVTPAVDRRPLWSYTFSGAAIALVVFIAVGLEGTLFYGGFTGTSLARGIFGNALDSLQAQGLIAFGIVITVMGVASMVVILGALLGWAVFELINAANPPGTEAEGENEA